MRLLVTGAGGMLGSAFVREGERRGLTVTAAARADLDVTDPRAVERFVAAWAAGARTPDTPGWVVHCAAYTAVDRAESQPHLARAVNVDGAASVARAAAAAPAGMVSISTDYVFDGTVATPRGPEDETGPLSMYGRTKLEGERAVREAYRRVRSAQDVPWATRPLIVRTGWLYGDGGRGFVRSMIERAERGERLRIVHDQIGGPTWTGTVADVVLDLISRVRVAQLPKVVHVADAGETSWYELARYAFGLAGLGEFRQRVQPVATKTYGAPARRPAFSVLDTERTEALLGRPMKPWRAVLAEVLAEPSGAERGATVPRRESHIE